MPSSLREWLPEDDFAWFVLAAVDAMDLSAFYAAYRGDGHGRAAHDPQMMVALLLFAYPKGERSSRAIERALHEDVRLPRDRLKPGARPRDDRTLSPAPRGRARRAVRRGARTLLPPRSAPDCCSSAQSAAGPGRGARTARAARGGARGRGRASPGSGTRRARSSARVFIAAASARAQTQLAQRDRPPLASRSGDRRDPSACCPVVGKRRPRPLQRQIQEGPRTRVSAPPEVSRVMADHAVDT
jgi:hypothetical protein